MDGVGVTEDRDAYGSFFMLLTGGGAGRSGGGGGASGPFQPCRRHGVCVGPAALRLPPGRGSGSRCSPTARRGPPHTSGGTGSGQMPLGPSLCSPGNVRAVGTRGAHVSRAAAPFALTVVACWTPC